MPVQRQPLTDYTGYELVRIVEWEQTLAQTLREAINAEYDSLATDFKGFPVVVENVELSDDREHEYDLLAGTCDVLLEQHDGRERYYDDSTFTVARGHGNDSIIVGEVDVALTLGEC